MRWVRPLAKVEVSSPRLLTTLPGRHLTRHDGDDGRDETGSEDQLQEHARSETRRVASVPQHEDGMLAYPEDLTAHDTSAGSLEATMANMGSTLNQLVRLAVSIRRSGTRSRLQKADRTFAVEEHQELRTHLVAVMAARAPVLDSGLTSIQCRLIEANLRRRNRFLYAQRHSERLAITTDPPYATLPSNATEEHSALLDWAYSILQSFFHVLIAAAIIGWRTFRERRQQAIVTTTAKRSPRVLPAMTGTSASKLSGFTAAQQVPARPQGAPTQISVTLTKVQYPRPPRIAQGAEVFRCPCCCQMLPVMFAEETRWK